jgi:hypothetical protein
MAITDRVQRYREIVRELTALIELDGTAEFHASEQSALPRVHEHYFAAVQDRQRS